jgi:enamine deaminase RidA (YjgF/YER057c/UK114 family)
MSDHSPMKKTFYSTPNHPYERRYGYYRAVRKGPYIVVAGTTPFDPATQKLLYPGDAGKQAAAIFTEIIKAVEAVGAKGAEDIIRVRVFLAVSIVSSNPLLPLIRLRRRRRTSRLLVKRFRLSLQKTERRWA